MKLYASTQHKIDINKIKSFDDLLKVIEVFDISFFTTFPKFNEIKEFLDYEPPPPTLDEILGEFDKNMAELKVRTQRNFFASKLTSENRYERNFDKIFDNFEYAKKYGEFPQTLELGNTYMINDEKFEYYIKDSSMYYPSPPIGYKPNSIQKFFMKVCFGFEFTS